MNAEELLKTWPGVDKANAETLLAMPAWRLRAKYNGEEGFVRAVSDGIADALVLDVTLDGESHLLGLGDTPVFPDLHLLWGRWEKLPPEIVLALVEKECGAFLQTLENSLRRQLSVVGVSKDSLSEGGSFRFSCGGGEIPFSIDLTPPLVLEWGRIENIDCGHETIREMIRPVSAEYAAFGVTDAEFAALAPGSFVMLPDGVPLSWRTAFPSDDMVHVLSSEATMVPFSAFADDALPEVPSPDGTGLILVRNGAAFAQGECTRLGLQRAVRLTSPIN